MAGPRRSLAVLLRRVAAIRRIPREPQTRPGELNVLLRFTPDAPLRPGHHWRRVLVPRSPPRLPRPCRPMLPPRPRTCICSRPRRPAITTLTTSPGWVIWSSSPTRTTPAGRHPGRQQDRRRGLRPGDAARPRLHYVLPGRVDGLTADPRHHRVIATVNEDLNSTLYTITPARGRRPQALHLLPDPAQTGSDGTNGGTDAVSVAENGTIYVAHSNPDVVAAGREQRRGRLHGQAQRHHRAPDPAVRRQRHRDRDQPGPGRARVRPAGPDRPRLQPLGPRPRRRHADPGRAGRQQAGLRHRPGRQEADATPAEPDQRRPPSGGDAPPPQLDDIVPAGGEGTLFVVDQKAGNIYTWTPRASSTAPCSPRSPRPRPATCRTTRRSASSTPKTGVVTHLATDVPLAARRACSSSTARAATSRHVKAGRG